MKGVAAIILAAGGSSRFGRPKQLATIAGVPLIRRAAELATAAGCGPVFVITGRKHSECEIALAHLPVQVIRNEQWERGMGTSLRAGIRAALDQNDVRRTFILLGDQPAITVQMLRRMADAHATASRPVAIAEFAGTIGPPALIDRSLLEELRDWPDAKGAKSLWQHRPELVTRVPCPEAATDIDTPDDLERFANQDVER